MQPTIAPMIDPISTSGTYRPRVICWFTDYRDQTAEVPWKTPSTHLAYRWSTGVSDSCSIVQRRGDEAGDGGGLRPRSGAALSCAGQQIASVVAIATRRTR
jgi:hypothetical protein